MKLYLHIGTEKTGTTTLQEVLYQNQSTLSDQGFHFIQSAGKRNNRAIPSICMDDDKFDDFWLDKRATTVEAKQTFRKEFIHRFEAELESLPEHIHSVIISSEHFHSRTCRPDEVRRVHRFLSNYFDDITVICFVREQGDTCVSLYSTMIKAGKNVSMPEMLAECVPTNIYYNYYEMLDQWQTAFGAANLVARRFDRNSFRNGDLVDDFFALLDESLLARLNRDVEVQNESLTVTGQYLGRAVNIAIPKYYDNGLVNPSRKKAINAIYKDFKGKGECLSQEQSDAIRTAFLASNRKLNAEYFGGSDSESCFSQAHRAAPENRAELQEEEIAKLVNLLTSIHDGAMRLPDRYASLFRDLAIDLEDTDPQKALMLMELAQMVRPSGPFILKKLAEYREKS